MVAVQDYRFHTLSEGHSATAPGLLVEFLATVSGVITNWDTAGRIHSTDLLIRTFDRGHGPPAVSNLQDD